MAVIHNSDTHSLSAKIDRIENKAAKRRKKPVIILVLLIAFLIALHSFPGGLTELGSTVCSWMQDNGMILLSVPVMMFIWLTGYLFIPVAIINVIRELIEDKKTYSEKKEVDIIRSGMEGETRALASLSSLSDKYHLFTNKMINYAGKQSETDLIVVGPTGVFVIEVKNYKGELYGKADDKNLTHIKTGGEEETVYNPLRQVSTHVFRLSGLLKEKGLRCWVEGLVFFTSDDLTLDIAKPDGEPKRFFTDEKELIRRIYSGTENIPDQKITSVVKAIDRN